MDGPRDCEAVAVDAATGQVLLISKSAFPPELFSLPLSNPHGQVQECAPHFAGWKVRREVSAAIKDPALAALFS